MSRLALCTQPRLLMTKLLERGCRRLRAPWWRELVRRHVRKWCVDDELLAATRAGFKMRASPRDYISYSIFFFGEYDPVMTQALRHLVREGDVAWDLGAERGWFTLLLGRLVGPRGQVHAFEAYPPGFEKLRANVALNRMPWIRLNAVAVSDRPGRMYFEPPSAAATQNLAYLDHCGGVGHLTDGPSPRALEVPTVRLDDYTAEAGLERLDFVKIDIEGAEIAALEGARQTLARFRPTLAIEYNRASLARAGRSWERLDALLDELGYDRFLLDDRFVRLELGAFRDVPDDHAVLNVYCFPRRAAMPAAAHRTAELVGSPT